MAGFVKQNTWVLTIVAVLSLAITSLTWSFINQQNLVEWWVEHTLQVINESEQALICLMDCETAYRGYLITRDKEYLEPYEMCYKHVNEHIEQLQKLTSDNAEQQAFMPELIQLAKDKIDFSQHVIAVSSASDPKIPGHYLVNLKTGKMIMDKFRADIVRVEANERTLLEKRKNNGQQLRMCVYTSAALLSLLLLALLVYSIISARAYVAQQAKDTERLENLVSARTKELQEAHDNLERLIQERTQQLSAALAEAQQANALKAQFVSTVSHEVRTPISGIIGLAEYLTKMQLQPEVAEISEHIYQSSKRLLNILNDLLDFSKLEAGKVEIDNVAFNLRKLIAETQALFERQCVQKGISMATEFAQNIPEKICGDEQKTRQILTNFLSNAIKFTQVGSIVVQASVESLNTSAMQLRLAVRDTGVGISPEAQKQIFQPFIQGDGTITRRFGGTGLGLSICKSYIDILGGEIGFESTLERGSTFWCTIPLLDEES